MFSSSDRLKKKTPSGGINRKEFIEHLVEEYYTTTDIEAQEQVTANLCNFAYDPINFQYLRDAQALQVFIEILSLPNESLNLHGVTGLCNICLDPQAFQFITSNENFKIITDAFLKTNNTETNINYITLYYQLLSICNSADLKQQIIKPEILKKILELRQNAHSGRRVVNLATIFLADFGTRNQVSELTQP